MPDKETEIKYNLIDILNNKEINKGFVKGYLNEEYFEIMYTKYISLNK